MPSLAANSMIAKMLAAMTGGASLSEDDPKAMGGLMKQGIPPTPPEQKGLLGGGMGSEQMQATMPAPMPQAQGGPQPTPPFNPNAPTPVPPQGGLLAMDPALAARMDPADAARATPGLLSSAYGFLMEGKTPRQIQRERAERMIADREAARGMQTREAIERQREELRTRMGPMPTDPTAQEAWMEQGARMVATAPVPDPEFTEQLRLAAAQLREREFAPQRETWTTKPMKVNGVEMMVRQSNTGQMIGTGPMEGVDLVATGARLEPIPLTDTFSALPGETAAGNVPLVGNRTGEVRDSGIARPDPSDRTTAATRKLASANRSQLAVIDAAIAGVRAYPNAVGLHRALGDEVNQRADPRGIVARANVANIGSLKIHDRTGATMAAKEAPRLTPFIPAVTNTADAVIQKLQEMRRFIEIETAELERGVGTPATPRPSTPATGRTFTLPNGKTFTVPSP